MMGTKKCLWGSGMGLGYSIVLFMTFAAAALALAFCSRKRAIWQVSAPKLHQDYSPTCDLFSGRWVYDDSTHPMYSGQQCPSMNDEIACDKYGRNDTRYKSWRWQPHGCQLTKFEARELLERLRGKRMVYVGDSLNRNQWASMVCLLESSIDAQHKSLKSNGSLKSFRAEEFDASIDFYWAPLLVESNCDDPVNHGVPSRIMRADSIEKHARHWTSADILVFNSYLWWEKPNMKMKVLYGSLDEDYKEVELIEGFELALKTWAEWLEMHVDTLKIQVFFVSPSPTHARKSLPLHQNCKKVLEIDNIYIYIKQGRILGNGEQPELLQRDRAHRQTRVQGRNRLQNAAVGRGRDRETGEERRGRADAQHNATLGVSERRSSVYIQEAMAGSERG